ILLIADEVQTGFARTGKMFAMQHHDVAPDITTMAKSLAGGFPLSAVTGRAELMDSPNPGGLGGTYAGNPLGIAAAHAVLDVIEEEKLVDRANLLGGRLKQRLESLRADVPEIVDIRGPGRSEEHTSELQSRENLLCRLLLEKKKKPLLHTTLRP